MPKELKQVATLDEVPESLREYYVPIEGGFAPAIDQTFIEQHPSTSGLRSALSKEKDERKAKGDKLALYEGIDPALARQLIEQHKKEAEKKLIDAGEVDKLFEQRTTGLKKEYETKIADLEGKLGSTTTHLEKLLVDSTVAAVAQKLGVRPSALDDVLLRARSSFKVENGQAVPYDANGNVIYGADTKPMKVEDWMKDLAGKAPHLFNEPQGGGTKPGAGSGPGAQAYTLTRAEAQDVAKYRRAKEAANKAGLALPVITD